MTGEAPRDTMGPGSSENSIQGQERSTEGETVLSPLQPPCSRIPTASLPLTLPLPAAMPSLSSPTGDLRPNKMQVNAARPGCRVQKHLLTPLLGTFFYCTIFSHFTLEWGRSLLSVKLRVYIKQKADYIRNVNFSKARVGKPQPTGWPLLL